MKRVAKLLATILLLTVCLSIYGCYGTEDNLKISNENGTWDGTILLDLNGDVININVYEDNGIWKEAECLFTDRKNRIKVDTIPENVEIFVNGEKLLVGTEMEFALQTLRKDDAFPIIIKYGDNKESVCYIRTLNWGLPEIDYYEDRNLEDGVYYTCIDGYCVKYKPGKGYVYYKKEEGCIDFKRTEIDGEIFYSYLVQDNVKSRPNYVTAEGYAYCKLVVMNEDYQIIDEESQLIQGESVYGEWPLEEHEHMILGKDHYLVLGYVPMYVYNIPDSIPHSPYGSRVLAAVIQEIKNGELIWEWNSTDYPIFYEMSMETNDFWNKDLQWSDYIHMNSFTLAPDSQDLVCS